MDTGVMDTLLTWHQPRLDHQGALVVWTDVWCGRMVCQYGVERGAWCASLTWGDSHVAGCEGGAGALVTTDLLYIYTPILGKVGAEKIILVKLTVVG